MLPCHDHLPTSNLNNNDDESLHGLAGGREFPQVAGASQGRATLMEVKLYLSPCGPSVLQELEAGMTDPVEPSLSSSS